MAKDKKEEEAPKVTRHPYTVLYAKNFGSGVVKPGATVELSKKAGDHYADLGFVKPLKK